MLIQRMLRLLELQGDVVRIREKLTAKDNRELDQVSETQARTAAGVGKTVGAAPNDDELYDQLLASTDRFREETENAIKIVEKILRRHR